MKNYKTTIVGIVGAVWLAVQPFLTKDGFDISKDWKDLIGAAIVATLGFVSKDFNVSGNPPKTIEPTSKAE